MGRIVIPSNFDIRAGDTIEIQVAKVTDDCSPSTDDEKHSGKYVVSTSGTPHHNGQQGLYKTHTYEKHHRTEPEWISDYRFSDSNDKTTDPL